MTMAQNKTMKDQDTSKDIKDFLKDRKEIKRSVLCRAIGWDTSSFQQWYGGTRPIPKEKEIALRKVLKENAQAGLFWLALD